MPKSISLTLLTASVSLLAVLIPANVAAQEDQRKPLVLVNETTRGRKLGSETKWTAGYMNPLFVLYSDGLVIFKKPGNAYELFSAQLTQKETDELMVAVNPKALSGLDAMTFTSRRMHPPIYSIRYWFGAETKMRRVAVAGTLKSDRPDGGDRASAPKAFLSALDQALSFERTGALPWVPKRVLIRVSPSQAKTEAVAWPKGWPDINHESSKKDRYIKDSYSVYLKGSEVKVLEQLLVESKERPVLISGKKWRVTPQRHCLPGEESWTP